MNHPSFIKMFKNIDVVLYPNIKATALDVVGSDNKIFEAIVPTEEADLLYFLKFSVSSKISKKEMNRLVQLIENFGQQKYEEGGLTID